MPGCVAFLGKVAYRNMTGQKDITRGHQQTTLDNAAVWILPNPSERNLDQLVGAYRQLYGVTCPVLSDREPLTNGLSRA